MTTYHNSECSEYAVAGDCDECVQYRHSNVSNKHQDDASTNIQYRVKHAVRGV